MGLAKPLGRTDQLIQETLHNFPVNITQVVHNECYFYLNVSNQTKSYTIGETHPPSQKAEWIREMEIGNNVFKKGVSLPWVPSQPNNHLHASLGNGGTSFLEDTST